MPDWLEQVISKNFRTWLDSDEGFPEGGSGPGLRYTEDDVEAAFRAGYLKRQDDED